MHGAVWGDKAEKKKEEDWQQLLAQVPISKKNNQSNGLRLYNKGHSKSMDCYAAILKSDIYVLT